MSISDLHPHPADSGNGPVAVLAEVVASLRDLDATWWTNQSDDVLVDTVGLVAQARSALAAVEAGAVAEADARDLAKDRLHHASTAAWVSHVGGLRTGDGKRLLARARALTGSLEATREGLVAGRVSPEQGDIIVDSLRHLPSGEAVRARGEAVLVEHAESLDASDLARTGRYLVHVVDPDAEDRRLEAALAREERAAHTDRYLTISPDGAGGVRVKGRGSAEDGATLKAALLPLTKPRPAATTPATGTGAEDKGRLCGETVQDPREAGARMWDALIATAQHALDTNLPPQSHGAPARLMVAVGLDALQNGTAGLAEIPVTGDGTQLSVAAVRRLACDAEIIPAVLGSHGEPLDVGRAMRLVSVAIWIALVLRDQHCAFPGCDRPPIMCHAHHILHWVLGGGTRLENLVLLCGHHHRVIHDSPWEVRLNPHDRKTEFLPPPKPGVEREWIRHRPRRE